MIYMIGSLRNPRVPVVAMQMRLEGLSVWNDWYSAGEHADDAWRDHEKSKGHTIAQALTSDAAQHVFNFDKKFLEQANSVVLLMPAGKSGFLELGWALGRGKKGYILLDQDPERYDVMFNFATGVYTDINSLITRLRQDGE